MNRINFTSNPNGKLFADIFSDVRLHDPERFFPAAKMDVYLKGMQMGTVQVVSFRSIEFRQITDILAYLVCGKPAAYLAALLRSYYENQITFTRHTQLDHIVFQWTSRNEEAHAHHLTEWWRAKTHQTQTEK